MCNTEHGKQAIEHTHGQGRGEEGGCEGPWMLHSATALLDPFQNEEHFEI